MKNIGIARDVRPHTSDAVGSRGGEGGPRFTAGAFFREAGTVIAVCLGLGLVVQFLLG